MPSSPASPAARPGPPSATAPGRPSCSVSRRRCRETGFLPASRVTGPLRAQKDAAEIDALRAAARVVDAVAVAMRDRPFAGRTEADISRELVERILEGGHERANFAIVASGPNAASPHHEPGERVVEAGDSVVCDFGGTMAGYCSDITRTFVVGEPSADLADLYQVLFQAQEQAVQAARVGVSCEAVDAAARIVIAAAGYGDYFIHRTGHGIGLEEHEDPYLVSGNATPLAARPRLLRRAGHLPARPVRRPHRGHRGGHRVRPRAPQRSAPRAGGGRLKLQVSTVLLQWAVGGLFFAWVTTRRREVGIGYGWTVRITYLVMALGAAGLGRWLEADGAAALRAGPGRRRRRRRGRLRAVAVVRPPPGRSGRRTGRCAGPGPPGWRP